MRTILFWFRSDLRLHDQPALAAALADGATHLLPVWCLPDQDAQTPWGFKRISDQRHAWLTAAARGLQEQLAQLNCPLLVCHGPAAGSVAALAQSVNAAAIYCEEIAAPEEQAELAALRAAGLVVHTVWQSSLLDPASLPWSPDRLSASFTPFRHALEKARVAPPAPLPAPAALPPWPAQWIAPAGLTASLPAPFLETDTRSSLVDENGHFNGAEQAGLVHLASYLARRLPETYKETRNGLTGADYSSKWSPWLATGALSARRIVADLRAYEAVHGASDGSYWLWFELLWRDYFRLLHLQYGRALYGARGLSKQPATPHNPRGFALWCEGRTGVALVDAAMRELSSTGYLSNRLRQVVASFLIYDLHADWRAGAAWFESQLLDYDVYSNQGNWLYLAGRGTDPRGGRRFNVQKQTVDHDGKGAYRQLWQAA